MNCLDRAGNEVDGYENPSGLFRFLYDCTAGKLLLGGVVRPGLSSLVGKFLDSRLSRCIISSFIRHSGIDMSCYEEGPFSSFNEFFRRKIRENTRTVDLTSDAVVSPCDGKVQVFNIDESSAFTIKGISYTMDQLLRDKQLAQRYTGGVLMLFRLGVDDYHRYSYPVDGIEGERTRLEGVLHTVDPIAAEHRPIYAENIREYSLIQSEDRGTVLMMEIGALMVGRIVNYHPTGGVFRGEEKGFFEFGASSIIVCYEKNMIPPDDDLLRNTSSGYETVVRQGERVGCVIPNAF